MTLVIIILLILLLCGGGWGYYGRGDNGMNFAPVGGLLGLVLVIVLVLFLLGRL